MAAPPAREKLLNTAYMYKSNTVTVASRTFAALNRYIDRVQAYADTHQGDVNSMKASLNEMAAKMPTALSKHETKTWACCVAALTYLGALPSDDANGTISVVPTLSGLIMSFEDLETQPAHERASLAAYMRVRVGA